MVPFQISREKSINQWMKLATWLAILKIKEFRVQLDVLLLNSLLNKTIPDRPDEFLSCKSEKKKTNCLSTASVMKNKVNGQPRENVFNT